MTGRIAHVLARCTGIAACARCTDAVDVTAHRWHAAAADEAHLAVCDTCAQRDDPHGYASLTAWRRAARQPAIGRRS